MGKTFKDFLFNKLKVASIAHFGLPIFRENAILFDVETASEREIQKIGLLVAEELASFWFGKKKFFCCSTNVLFSNGWMAVSPGDMSEMKESRDLFSLLIQR